MNSIIQEVTQRIIERSQGTRKAYLEKIEKARLKGPHRGVLSCGNLAHGFAACGTEDKADLRSMIKANIAIVSSYNDMLSAHQPYEDYPAILKKAIAEVGSVAQFAGGVPAILRGVRCKRKERQQRRHGVWFFVCAMSAPYRKADTLFFL